ncbi:MAG: methionine adenosyltransferase [Sandaracinus sp.]|jgi:S-adenosylmethionine synthetase
MSYLFTSESVTEGHPDKLCDAISDSVLDAILEQDPRGRVACETMVKTGYAIVAGEITTTARIDYPKVIRQAIREVGYLGADMGFDADTCAILTAVEQQSPDIALGVDTHTSQSKDQGAGDQGLMFGFAVDETKELMPMPIQLAHRMAQRLTKLRKDGTLGWLRPDGKTQCTVEYGEDGKAKRLDALVISTQHHPDVKQKSIKEALIDEVIYKVCPREMIDKRTNIYINPTGRFVIGGPVGDAGLTGRKIIVDTYGGMGRHGGGAFSGKDPSKVDRSAAYFARYVAKNVVASGVASKCEVQVAYAIGIAKPMGVYVNTFGTAKVDERKIEQAVIEMFDFRPRALVETLDLLRPIYRPTAAYGHFGRSEKPGFFTWEKTDRADELRDRLFGTKASGKAAKVEAPKAKKPAEKKAEAKKPAKKGKESGAEA